MSVYTGRQHPGAAREHDAEKRTEADTRQARYDHRVLRYAIEHGVTEDEARKLLRLEGYVLHQIGGAA